MGGVVGIKQQRRIARIEHGQGQVGCALLRAHQQQHLPLRIHRNPEAPLSPGGHSLTERQGGAMQAVGRALRPAQLIANRLDRRFRRLQIGGAEREIQQGRQTRCNSAGPVGLFALIVAGEDPTAEGSNPLGTMQGRQHLRDGHPGRP